MTQWRCLQEMCEKRIGWIILQKKAEYNSILSYDRRQEEEHSSHQKCILTYYVAQGTVLSIL